MRGGLPGRSVLAHPRRAETAAWPERWASRVTAPVSSTGTDGAGQRAQVGLGLAVQILTTHLGADCLLQQFGVVS